MKISVKIWILFVFLIFGVSAFAQAVTKDKEMIPFAAYTYNYVTPTLMNDGKYSIRPEAKGLKESYNTGGAFAIAQINRVSKDELRDFVKNLHDNICKSVGDADVKVWLNAGTEGNVIVVVANMQTGIEVTFHCKTTAIKK